MTDRTAPAKEASGVTDELIEQCLQHVRSFEAIGGTGAYPFSVRLAKRVLSQHAELSRRSSPVREGEGGVPSLTEAVELFADAADYNLTCWDACGDGPIPANVTRLYELGQEARALLARPSEPSGRGESGGTNEG